jgi:hypothetical protein
MAANDGERKAARPSASPTSALSWRRCLRQWNLDALKIEFEQLVVVDAPIEISGFAPAEIDHILLGDEADGLETGPSRPQPARRRFRGPATSFSWARTASFAATPEIRKSSVV